MSVVNVDIDDVRNVIRNVFPEFRYIISGKMSSMYEFHTQPDKFGLYISIKIPIQNKPGHGIHLTVRNKFKNDKGEIIDYTLYAPNINMISRFETGYIRRSSQWKENVIEAIAKGIREYNIQVKKLDNYRFEFKRLVFQYQGKGRNLTLEKFFNIIGKTMTYNKTEILNLLIISNEEPFIKKIFKEHTIDELKKLKVLELRELIINMFEQTHFNIYRYVVI